MTTYSVDAGILREAVFDRCLSEVGDSLLEARVTSPVRIGEMSLTAAGELTARVLNHPADADEDAVFGEASSHIVFDRHSAWVKYKLIAKGSWRAGAGLVAANAERTTAFLDYRIHPATERAWNAITSDLTSPRALLDLADVRALLPGEALAMELDGAIDAEVRFSWADVLGNRLIDILDGLPSVPVRLSSALEAAATARIRDRFFVVVSRTPDRHFRFSVTKATSQNHSYRLEGDLDASATAAAVVAAMVDPLVATLPGVVEDDVRELLQERLDAAAQWKLQTALAYEYGRVAENSAVADFVLLDDSLLESDHAHAIRGDVASIARDLARNSGARRINRYLNDSTLTRRSAHGFSLGIAKWIDVSTNDESSFRLTTRTSADGFQLVTAHATRRYEESGLAHNDFEWTIDLKAQMDEFLERPVTNAFDYGLHYAVSIDERLFSADTLRRIVDFAAMWNIDTSGCSVLNEVVGHVASARIQILFDRDALAATLREAAAGNADAFAGPLAMAMPYMPQYRERSAFDRRANAYQALWRDWLRGGERSAEGWAAALHPHVGAALLALEERRMPGSFVWTIERHPHLRDRLASFLDGTAKMLDAMTSPLPPDAIGAAYASLERFWSQRLYVAASGRYLLDCAARAGVQVNCTLQVECADETITV